MTNNSRKARTPEEQQYYLGNIYLEGGPDDGRTLRIQLPQPGKFPRAHLYRVPSLCPTEYPYHLYMSTGHVSDNQMIYRYKGMFK